MLIELVVNAAGCVVMTLLRLWGLWDLYYKQIIWGFILIVIGLLIGIYL